ncbi:MAG: hypothetical protein J6S54_12125, partial [Lentisphaeria bacterium]|nr:hypothetical protein [Lentisphaeria bacterium]
IYIHSSLIPEKATRTAAGASLFSLKEDQKIVYASRTPEKHYEGFEKCRKNLTPENQQKFDLKKVEDAYTEMSRSLGTPVSFSYLTELEFVTFKIYVWKIKFRRVGKEQGTGSEKEFFSEALFRVISGRTAKDQVMIMGFNFL